MSKNTYAGQKIAIIAEGADTVMFLKHLCEVYKITEPIYYLDFTIEREKGDDIENGIEELLLETTAGLQAIAIIADAAEDRQKMQQRVEELVEKHSNADCQISFLLLPHEGNGGLESLLIQAIKPEHEKFKECAQIFLQCIGNPHEAKIEKNDKALLHLIEKAHQLTILYAMIAGTNKPQLNLEDFMLPRGKNKNRSHYANDFFDFHHPAIASIATYLANLANPQQLL